MGEANDSRVDKIKRKRAIAKKEGKCGLCPMHDGENKTGWKKFGTRKPKSKNHDHTRIN